MGALKETAVMLEIGNIYVGDDVGSLVDLGALRNLRFTGKQNNTKIESDNRGTIVNRGRLQGEVSFDWLEAGSVDNLENLFKGLVTKSSVAGSLVSGATVVKTSGNWAYNQPILLNQNADGTAPTITSVIGSVDGTLVANVDRVLVKNPTDGKWYVQILDSTTVTTTAQTITITYSYTPAASKKLVGGKSLTATKRYVRIVGPLSSDSNTTRTIDLPECTAVSDLLLPFVDVENAGDVAVMPVTLEQSKSNEWSFEDEINVT